MDSEQDQFVEIVEILLDYPKRQRPFEFEELRKRMSIPQVVVDRIECAMNFPDEPDPEDRIGQAIGEFQVEKVLGRGGMGVVFRAVDPQLQRPVALKMLRHSSGWSNEKFMAEFRKQASVQHDTVAQIYSVSSWFDPEMREEIPYAVMEYIEGASAINRFAEGRALPKVVDCFLSVLKGMQQMHERLVLHLDLQPNNILVNNSTDHPKIIDFGIAEHLHPRLAIRRGYIAGTPQYMSPEVVSDNFGPRGPRSDVYSLGVLLFQLISGSLPYVVEGTTYAEITRCIVESPRDALSKLRPDLPPQLNNLVSSATSLEQSKRPETVAELASQLRGIAIPNRPAGGLANVDTNNGINPTESDYRTGIDFAVVPCGSFRMGSNFGDQSPPHIVKISNAFLIGKYPVTNRQYEKFLRQSDRSRKPDFWTNDRYNGPEQPVVGVRWEDAIAYCDWAGPAFRLPTEAEWEYACAATSNGKFCFGNGGESKLANYAWFQLNSKLQTHPVGEKKENKWGIHDMHGNVYEWCEDLYSPSFYQAGIERDPKNLRDGQHRVARGGSWVSKAVQLRSTSRCAFPPGERRSTLGFRVVKELTSGLSVLS
ncbi:MAG: bifunctional serine/threonine-protein kinase/formylglycine-generating enzyme family protein [Planctomycetota bacterium]